MERSTFALLFAAAALLLNACSNDGSKESDRDTGEDATANTCDPVVQEYRELMLEYEASLTNMVATGKVDKAMQDDWMQRMRKVVERARSMGLAGLGETCWAEFQAEARTLGPRVAELNRKLVKIRLHGEGVDTTALGQPRHP